MVGCHQVEVVMEAPQEEEDMVVVVVHQVDMEVPQEVYLI